MEVNTPNRMENHRKKSKQNVDVLTTGKSDKYIFPRICGKNVVKSRKSSAKVSEKSM